ncbi:MAG: potassium/proton antiporter [Clostridia bacterium]|nr:potassium/proton antiporter [Clostridia bacterium]
MAIQILLAAAVILICLSLTRLSNKIGLPTLAVFIAIGMLFGSDGIVRIPFDNYTLSEQLCSVALIFIMFYGGFGTSWRHAKGTAPAAIALSTFGVVLTALLTGVFCRFVLKISWLESFLIGSVISSTDAASVFSILRSRKLNLKYNTASLLEVESGSNDPCAYMMTVIVLTLMEGSANGWVLAGLVLSQILVGVIMGVIFAYVGRWLLKHMYKDGAGYDSILIFGIVLLSYALSTMLRGNGYLSVYITGLMLGNMSIPRKKTLVHFFDGVTGLMQISLFFLLGLLSFPSQLPEIALTGLAIALFITFIARPLAVYVLTKPFRFPFRQQLLISWAGLRGAASIVFAIMAVVSPAVTPPKLFNIVFFIVLFSILIQGSLLPFISRKLKMIDNDEDVMKTFSDYSDEIPVHFLNLIIDENHPWAHQALKNIQMLPQVRVAILIRDEKQMIPRGSTVVHPGDVAIICGPALEEHTLGALTEIRLNSGHDWIGRTLKSINMDDDKRVIMIQRDQKAIIPDGSTRLARGDILIVNNK